MYFVKQTLILSLFFILINGCSDSGHVPDEFVLIHYLGEDEDSQNNHQFRTINIVDFPVSYMGYSPANPDYLLDVQTDTGWVNIFHNWCLTGMSDIVLESRSFVEFSKRIIYVEDTQYWRLGMNFWNADEDTSFVIYTDPIP